MSCRVFFVTLIVIVISSVVHPASAQQHRGTQIAKLDGCTLTNSGRQVCGPGAQAARLHDSNGNQVAYAGESVTIIGGRPSGCPRQYCGCGLRKHLGLEDKRLDLARNWARLFPRVSGPAAGVAAVRSGHVMYIERSAGDGRWLVRDYNSGGGLSRLHIRDVRGHIFVNPHAQMVQR